MNICLYLVWQEYGVYWKSELTAVSSLILCEVCVLRFVAKSFLSVRVILTNQGLCQIINCLSSPSVVHRSSAIFRHESIFRTLIKDRKLLRFLTETKLMKKVFDQSTHQLVKRSTILFQNNAETIMWSHFREEKPKTKNLRLTDNKHV